MSIKARRDEPGRCDAYQPGDIIGGKYRLLRLIGQGSMGSVWDAVNLVLDSKVAIKLLDPELRSISLLDRFLREARSAAMLDHPAIVRVYDLGSTAGGDPFIVMELLTGESLGACLNRTGALAPELAAQILLPIVSAVQRAHEHGIVHRDLKPDNLMLVQACGGVQPKVVDFGIAKLKWGDESSIATGATIIGTPDYMAPEQAQGLEVVDRRADVWSLAVVLYEMVAGKTPFARDRISDTLRAVVDDPPASLADQGVIDDALWAILERALRKAPDARFSTMGDFGEALALWLRDRGVNEDATGASIRAHWHTDTAPGMDSRRSMQRLLASDLAALPRVPLPSDPPRPRSGGAVGGSLAHAPTVAWIKAAPKRYPRAARAVLLTATMGVAATALTWWSVAAGPTSMVASPGPRATTTAAAAPADDQLPHGALLAMQGVGSRELSDAGAPASAPVDAGPLAQVGVDAGAPGRAAWGVRRWQGSAHARRGGRTFPLKASSVGLLDVLDVLDAGAARGSLSAVKPELDVADPANPGANAGSATPVDAGVPDLL